MSSVGLVHFWLVSVAGLPSPASTERLNSQSPGRKSGSCSAASAGRASPAKRKAAAVRMEATPVPLRQSIVCPLREPVEEGRVGRGRDRQVELGRPVALAEEDNVGHRRREAEGAGAGS